MSYLTEAFKALDALNEDTFSVSDDGIKKLAEFEDSDDLVDEITVYDADAEDTEDLEDSYVGKVIVDCNVCHSKIYKDKSDVVIDEETQNANITEECPYCYSTDGFKVIGEVAPMTTETEEKVEVEDDIEESCKSEMNESLNEAVEPGKYVIRSFARVANPYTAQYSRQTGKHIGYLGHGGRSWVSYDDKGIMTFDTYEDAAAFAEDKVKDFYNAEVFKVERPLELEESCKSGMNEDKTYIDAQGGFGEPGEKITFTEIKKYWDDNSGSDPSLKKYDSFEDWFEETRKNYLKETDESLNEAVDLLTRENTIASVLSKHMDELSEYTDANSMRNAIIDILDKSEIADKDAVKKLKRVLFSKKSTGALLSTIATYMTGEKVAKVGRKMKEAISDMPIEDIESFTAEVKRRFPGSEAIYDGDTNTIKITLDKKNITEDLGRDIDEYQQWVDYDMKRYGKISGQTNKEIKEAGLQVVKDKYGDYQVIAGKYDESIIPSKHSVPFIMKSKIKNESLNESRNNKYFKDLDKIRYFFKSLLNDLNWSLIIDGYSLKDLNNVYGLGDGILFSCDLDEDASDSDLYEAQDQVEANLAHLSSYYEDMLKKNYEGDETTLNKLLEEFDNFEHETGVFIDSENTLYVGVSNKALSLILAAKNAYDKKQLSSNESLKESVNSDVTELEDGVYQYRPLWLPGIGDKKEVRIVFIEREDDVDPDELVYDIEVTIEDYSLDETKLARAIGCRNNPYLTSFDYDRAIYWCGKIRDYLESLDSDNLTTDLIDLGLNKNAAIKMFGEDNNVNKEVESLKESVKDVTITTDDSRTIMTSEADGKVTVTTEPVEQHKDDEVIKPVTSETEAEIEANDGEEDIDIEDFDEESFDELGEGYFKNVYENVNSFKTSNVRTRNNKVIVEGVITFENDVKKNTSFLFESANKTKSGKYRFIGENLNVTKGNKAFSLIGNVTNKKFLSESMNYNYRTKNDIGKSIRCCGTIKRG